MDAKGKLFGKLSIIDLLVVLLLVAAGLGLSFKLFSGSETVAVRADAPFVLELKVPRVRDYTVAAVAVGDQIYEQHANLLGTVTAVETRPAKELVDRGDGTQTYGEVEGRFDLFITIEAKGRINEDGYAVDGTRFVAPGGTINIESQTVQCESLVESVRLP